jgi:hypothetical protein
MDVMGTLDLSIQGWFINPDDIVRTLPKALPPCLAPLVYLLRWFSLVLQSFT